MAPSGSTWLALVRDLSASVSVANEPTLVACLILDTGTGSVMAGHVATDEGAAVPEALDIALHRPAKGAPRGVPGRIACRPVDLDLVTAAVGQQPALDGVDIVAAEPGDEAEDIFDSLVGHLAGRGSSQEPPLPEDWRVLYEQARAFVEAEPWLRWSDEVDLRFEATIEGDRARRVLTVLGNLEVQRGLAVFPDAAAATRMRRDRSGHPRVDPGTVIATFDRPEELPVEIVAKSVRYGWPIDAELVAAFFAIDAGGGSEISSSQARLLAGALAAVVALDRRGPLPAGRSTDPVEGLIALDDGVLTFSVALLHRGPRQKRGG